MLLNKIHKSKHAEFVRFCIVGVGNTLINYLIFAIFLKFFGVHYIFAGGLGFLSGAITGFFVNRHWTFKSSVSIKTHLPAYLAVNVFSLLVNAGVQWIVVEHWMVREVLSQLYGIVVTTITNYLLAKYFVFNSMNS